MLSGELGVSQAFLARWYISGGYMDVSLIAYNTTGMMHLKIPYYFTLCFDLSRNVSEER